MAKIKFTKYGVFKKSELILNIDYSDIEYNQGGRIHTIETLRKVVEWEPVILWNLKGYLKELEEA